MKPAPRLRKKIRTTAPFILALLLAVALVPGAALANPGPPPPSNTPAPPGGGVQQAPAPPDNQQAPPPPDDDNTQQAPPPPPGGNQQQTPTTEAHPDAPNYPSADCIVTHAATPAQLCPVSGGLQYYFIGKDGSSQTGPYIKPFSELVTLHTVGASVRLYTGSNPFTSKSVHIDYLPADSKLRISTYYPDTMYDTDKPYVFTVDTGNSVNHENW